MTVSELERQYKHIAERLLATIHKNRDGDNSESDNYKEADQQARSALFA